MAEHICRGCVHRDGEWCKFSDALTGAVPPHITWWAINWDEAPDCSVPDEDLDEDDAATALSDLAEAARSGQPSPAMLDFLRFLSGRGTGGQIGLCDLWVMVHRGWIADGGTGAFTTPNIQEFAPVITDAGRAVVAEADAQPRIEAAMI